MNEQKSRHSGDFSQILIPFWTRGQFDPFSHRYHPVQSRARHTIAIHHHRVQSTQMFMIILYITSSVMFSYRIFIDSHCDPWQMLAVACVKHENKMFDRVLHVAVHASHAWTLNVRWKFVEIMNFSFTPKKWKSKWVGEWKWCWHGDETTVQVEEKKKLPSEIQKCHLSLLRPHTTMGSKFENIFIYLCDQMCHRKWNYSRAIFHLEFGSLRENKFHWMWFRFWFLSTSPSATFTFQWLLNKKQFIFCNENKCTNFGEERVGK